MIPLTLIREGERAEIVNFLKKGKDFYCQLRDIGFITGKVIEVLSNKGHGPILLKLNDARIAIGRGMAMKIFVRRLQ